MPTLERPRSPLMKSDLAVCPRCGCTFVVTLLVSAPSAGTRSSLSFDRTTCPGGDNPIASHATGPALARWPA